jgi:hypothetical protein
MLKEERMHATTSSQMDLEPEVDCMQHIMDPGLMTESKDEIKVWGYLMTQYNLKPGLRKFGEWGATAARDELTLLQIMDTWKAMDPSKILREDESVLITTVFVRRKERGKSKGKHAPMGHHSGRTSQKKRQHRLPFLRNQPSLQLR